MTVAMIAIEMPAAIKPYSIAVAPERSFKNRLMADMEYLKSSLAIRNSMCLEVDID